MEEVKKPRWSNDELKLIGASCIPHGATEEEKRMFLYLCDQYNLDPLKKEMYFMKYGVDKPATFYTSRDGYLKIAQGCSEFDGIEADAVYMGDRLTKRDDASYFIEYGENHMKFDRNQLTGAFCNVFRKDRSKATSVFVSLQDYDKKKNMWLTYPNAMIMKIAESQALKRAFALSGLTTKEEIGGEE
jgi:phage recombination protein Bet